MGCPRSSRMRGSGALRSRSSLSLLLLIPLTLPPLPYCLTRLPAPHLSSTLPSSCSHPVPAVTSEAGSPSLLGRNISCGDRKSVSPQFFMNIAFIVKAAALCLFPVHFLVSPLGWRTWTSGDVESLGTLVSPGQEGRDLWAALRGLDCPRREHRDWGTHLLREWMGEGASPSAASGGLLGLSSVPFPS